MERELILSGKNCWEFKNCGRHPNGRRVEKLGVCRAAIEVKLNGVNGGVNGGRACWTIEDVECGAPIENVFAVQLAKCLQCDFYKSVNQ